MISKVRTSDYLFTIIENNERTANMLDLTKYLIYKATNVPYGVLSFDFEEYSLSAFSQTSGLYGATIQEKVWWAVIDAGYSKEAAAGVLGNIEAESGFDPDVIEGGTGIGFGLCQWSYGRRTQLESYAASKGMDPGNENVQIEFLIGEITPGGGADGYANYQLLTYNGYSPSDWENATTPEDAAIAFCWSFERPGVPRMDVRTEAARRYYEQFKDAERPSGGEFLQIASETWAEVCSRFTTYGGTSIPPAGPQIDCSSFVTWVLYKYGYTEFGGWQKTTANYYDDSWTSQFGWTVIPQINSIDDLQPGDIVVCHNGYAQHMNIFVENRDGVAYCYDCGDASNWLGKNGEPMAYNFWQTPGAKIIRVTPPSN